MIVGPLPRVGMMSLANLQTLTEAAAFIDLPGLERYLRASRAFVDAVDTRELLAGLVRDPDARNRIAARNPCMDHCAALCAVRPSKAAFRELAAACGFDEEPTFFPSQIVARELGERSGTASVPTTIFTARGRGPGGRSIGVELFIPHATLPTVRAWARERVSHHFALSLPDPSDAAFVEVTRAMLEEGFRIPAFVGRSPLVLPRQSGELFVTTYFDGEIFGRHHRIEFCGWRNADNPPAKCA
jgi:hypothetical protein